MSVLLLLERKIVYIFWIETVCVMKYLVCVAL